MKKPQRIYCPSTTEQQRNQLFETWEATGSVSAACRKARVSRQTFYNWKERFTKGGYAALENPRSHARKDTGKIGSEIEQKIIEMRKANPKWGKRRITDELAKANGWVPLVSHTTVKRVLKDAGLWPQAEDSVKKGEQKQLLEPQMNQAKR